MKKIMNKGFTLIELLIVMAILGVLAVVVLVAINPAEQLARTRDSGRFSSITQIGHSIQSYYTTRSEYPTATTWDTDLTTAGELTTIPAEVVAADGATCTSNPVEGWCYADDGASPVLEAIVYTPLESTSNNSKCPAASPVAWMMYSMALGKGGIVCTAAAATEPAASTATPPTYTFY